MIAEGGVKTRIDRMLSASTVAPSNGPPTTAISLGSRCDQATDHPRIAGISIRRCCKAGSPNEISKQVCSPSSPINEPCKRRTAVRAKGCRRGRQSIESFGPGANPFQRCR